MTRDEARARVQFQLGNRSDLATQIVTALQDAQSRMEREAELPWFLVSEIETSTTAAEEERIALPDDFLREWDEDGLWYYNSAASDAEDVWTLLCKTELDFARIDYPGTGVPQAYTLDEGYFRIFPTPDAAYLVKMKYYKADTVLATNITNQWLTYAPDILIGQAGLAMGSALGLDRGRMEYFVALEQRGVRRLQSENQARMQSNREYIIGGRD